MNHLHRDRTTGRRVHALAALLGLFGVLLAPCPAASASVPRPVILRLSASTGTAAGGTPVVITGRRLTRRTVIFFGGVRTRATYRGARKIVAIAPPHSPGTVQVVARNGRLASRATGRSRYTYTPVAAPVAAPAHATWAAVSAGVQHTCAVKSDHTLWCWGRNYYGQLGTPFNAGNTQANPVPGQVGTGHDWVSVSAGTDHTCGIKGDGTLWCWGENSVGQIGSTSNLGTYAPNPVPARVGASADWSSVAAGSDVTCGLRTNHTLWCWGSNLDGEIGSSTNVGTTSPNPAPVQVGSATTWAAVSVGANHACAVRSDHTLWCWGDNAFGQLGNLTNVYTYNPNPTPAQVAPGASWALPAADANHTCATRTDHTLWCWGINWYGELGTTANTGTDNANPPTQVVIAGWSQPSAGASHTCSTRIDGTMWCWGLDDRGELGDGVVAGTDPNPAPAEVGTATSWSQLSTAAFSTCATRVDGTLWCWGSNLYGQLGTTTNLGVDTANPTPIQVPS